MCGIVNKASAATTTNRTSVTIIVAASWNTDPTRVHYGPIGSFITIPCSAIKSG